MNRPLLLLCLGAALAAPLSASAQFTSINSPSGPFEDLNLTDTKTGEVTRARDKTTHFQIKTTGAAITPGTRVPDNTEIVEVETGRTFVTHANRRYFQAGVYFASFGIAGPIQQNDGSFAGGTDNSNNPLVSVDFGIPLRPHDGTLTLGGWYFFSPNGHDFDLYQAQVKYGLRHNSAWGGQVAYLNNVQGDAQSFTFHWTYTLSSAVLSPGQKPWGVEFGAGILNATNRQPLEAGGTRDRNTIDPSFFVNANWNVYPRTSLLATLWSVRDRNVDITRLGIGLAYRF